MQNRPRLDFNRFNVHTKDKTQLAEETQKVESEIAQAELNNQTDFIAEYAYEYRQLAIEYAFALRNHASARKNAEKYKSSVTKDTFEYGVALNLLGNANFMAGGDSDAAPFVEALAVFEKLEKDITDDTQKVLLKIEQGFAHRYIGLGAHRDSMYSKDKELSKKAHRDALHHFNGAKKKFEEAKDIQNKTYVSSFPIDLDLIETIHLLGVRQTRQEQYADAIAYLNAALEIERKFNAKSGATHFLTFITLQSLGEAYLLNGDNDLASKLLLDTMKEQEEFYGKRQHIDIAKTLHFIGLAHANLKDWYTAIPAFQEALDIKVKLLKPEDRMIAVTKTELSNAVNSAVDFDWNNYLTIERNKAIIPGIELFDLDGVDSSLYAHVRYRIGTFHIHINGNSKAAMPHFTAAEQTLKDEDLLWTQIHMAFCHQKDAYSNNQTLKEIAKAKSMENIPLILNLDEQNERHTALKNNAITSAITISDKIITQNESKLSADNLNLVKIVAFAYAIKALTQYEDGKLPAAIKTYERSKELYETYGLQNDGDQYARVVNRLAMMYEENKNVAEAKAAYEILATYWAKQTIYQKENNLPQNIYQARYYDTYATFLENSGNLSAAIAEVEKAYAIREKTEPTSSFTQKNKDRLAKMLATYAATQKAEQRPAAVTSFPGSFHGSTQPPKPASFAGTSVTMSLDSKSEATEELAQTMRRTIL